MHAHQMSPKGFFLVKGLKPQTPVSSAAAGACGSRMAFDANRRRE